jgi:oligopeptide/dipeptide ABC transporter ATP-binding protein
MPSTPGCFSGSREGRPVARELETMEPMAREELVLSVSDLRTCFDTNDGVVRAVDGVSFHVNRGEVLGLVGESGCGKSVTALSLLRLIASPPGRIAGGEVSFQGRDLLRLGPEEMRKIRGEKISMIFQDPLTCLNPVFRVGFQLSEVFRHHRGFDRLRSLKESIRMLKMTEIPSPEERARNYPHELSGGMRQRAMIAMALACEPALLIADEPTTALDVTVQAQVLTLIGDLCRRHDTAVLLITHDMGVVARMCHRVAVMYAGTIVEYTDVFTLFRQPAHPYTRGLLRALPRLGSRRKRLDSIEGQPPRLNRLPRGCPFEPRCDRRQTRCGEERPGITRLREGHETRCHYPIRAAEGADGNGTG